MAPEMASEQDHWEALERALNETEVLNAIYGGDDDDDEEEEAVTDSYPLQPQQQPPSGSCSASSFAIVSPGTDEVDRIKRALLM